MKAAVLSAIYDPKLDAAASSYTAANMVWRAPFVSVRDVPEPSALADDEVLIEVCVNGICGSDVHASEAGPDGYVRFSGPARLPVVLGHEFVGRVISHGVGATNLRVGQFVSAESVQACRKCRPCRAGHLNQCASIDLIGLTVDGALAPLVRVKEFHCHPIDQILERFGEERGIELGAALEPLGCAFNGMFIDRDGRRREGVTRTDRVAVFGVGPIGLGAIALARCMDVSKIIAFDLSDERADLAKRLGADAAFNVGRLRRDGHSLCEAIDDVTDGEGVSVVVEAAGAPGLFAEALAVLSERGSIIYLGRTPEQVSFDANQLVSKAIYVNGSRGHAGYGIFPSLIEMIASGRLDLSHFVTARFDFADLAAAFARAREQRDGKILIQVSS